MTKLSAEITIVGAGIVGASLALAIAPSGLNICLIDAGAEKPATPKDSDYRPRVSAINLATMQFFKHLEVWKSIHDTRVSAYSQMQVWDANSTARIEFISDETQFDQLGYIIENDLMVECLLENLASYENVHIFANTTIGGIEQTDQNQIVIINSQRIETKLLVGADGQDSATRKLLNIPVETGHFNQKAIVARIQTELPHQQTAYQCFHSSGPLAYLPLADGSCSIVWSCDDAYAKQLLDLDQQEMESRIAQGLEHKLGEVTLLSKPVGFALKQVHAQRYITDRAALVGDAAHRTHPLAGLGANIGVLDTAALAQVLLEKHSAGRDIGLLRNLRPYERWRRGQNTAVLGAMQGFKSVFGSDHPTLSAIREIAMNSVDNSNSLKSLLNNYAMGTSQHLFADLPTACIVQPQHV